MKKLIFVVLTLCIWTEGFAQTALTPKKKKVSPQFEKLTKYELTNNTEPVYSFTQYGIPLSIHLENADEGFSYYSSQGNLKADMKQIKTGTIVAGYSGNKIIESMLIFDYSEDTFGLYIYEAPASRNFLFVDKYDFTLDELIEKLIEDQTNIKWIKDEL